jgi:hypothetical protein
MRLLALVKDPASIVLRRQVLGDEDEGARRGHGAGEEVA